MSATVLKFAQGTRRLSSWIGGFLEYSSTIQSNQPFRLWSAIGAVSAALERKVWVNSQRRPTYPNLYIFLVGPPGTGKTSALVRACDVWQTLAGLSPNEHHIARVSLTKAALMDQLASANRMVGDHIFNSLFIPSLELGALIPNYDPDFLNAMTYLYDSIKYDEQRRGAPDPLIIEKPIVNLIGCTTPSYLINTMPAGAWDQGFLARVIIIYSDITEHLPLNLLDEEPNDDKQMRDALIHDIQEIGSRSGRLQFTRDSAEFVERWNERDRDATAPSHPRLQHYNTRRPIHLLKLCIIATADSGHDNIELSDAQAALDWLYSAEKMMGDVFVAMASGGDANVMNECWHFAITAQIRNPGEPIPQETIHRYLSGRVPAYTAVKLVAEMVRCGMLEYADIKGVPAYRPRASFKQF